MVSIILVNIQNILRPHKILTPLALHRSCCLVLEIFFNSKQKWNTYLLKFEFYATIENLSITLTALLRC